MPPRSLHHRLAAEDGFSIVEVLVASVVLVVGLLGLLTLVDTANTTTFQTKSREQATSLQREIVEGARAVSYDQLGQASLSDALRGRPGLGDTSPSAGWSIRRRGTTYTIAVGTCIVDDPRDGIGAHDADSFCDPATVGQPAGGCQAFLDATPSASAPARTTGATSGPAAAACGIDADLDGVVENLTTAAPTTCTAADCDRIPADYKRVVSMVRWEQGSDRRSNLMVTTVSNPGLSAAPAVTSLTAAGGTLVADAGTQSIAFTATASPAPASVVWYLDGAQMGPATGTGDTWTWTWSLGPVTLTDGAQPAEGELLDGTYVVAAKAFDRYGQSGTSRSVSISINRRRPFAPRSLRAGRNGDIVDLEWAANAEGDLEGYRVFRLDSAGAAEAEVCALTAPSAVSCQDTSPPPRGSGVLRYVAVAVDRDAGGLRQGDQSTIAEAVDDNRPPNPPASLSATLFEGNVKLVWPRPDPEDPDDGYCDPTAATPRKICHFNIYRDGQLYANRYDRTATGEQLEWIDTQADGTSHTYYVTSVDRHLAESVKVGSVSP